MFDLQSHHKTPAYPTIACTWNDAAQLAAECYFAESSCAQWVALVTQDFMLQTDKEIKYLLALSSFTVYSIGQNQPFRIPERINLSLPGRKRLAVSLSPSRVAEFNNQLCMRYNIQFCQLNKGAELLGKLEHIVKLLDSFACGFEFVARGLSLVTGAHNALSEPQLTNDELTV